MKGVVSCGNALGANAAFSKLRMGGVQRGCCRQLLHGGYSPMQRAGSVIV
ncbi:MAG: hypothetical protein ABII71_06380 [Candidatus Micrarchaeota archaeon]